MAKFNYWQNFEENVHYHIYNRSINGTNLFRKEENFNFFLRRWKLYIHPFFDTYTFCLMPNHFHFLVRVKPYTLEIQAIIKKIETSKSRQFLESKITYNEFLLYQFKRLFSSYALALNKQEKRTGSLFQKRFKRVGIHNEIKLQKTIAYIHHNPIHHSYSKDYKSWKHSSYSNILQNIPLFVNNEDVLSCFDDNIIKAKFFFMEYHKNYKMDNEIHLDF